MSSIFFNVIVDKPYYLPKYGGDIVKLAIKLDFDMGKFIEIDLTDKLPSKLCDFVQKETLPTIIQELATFWNLENPINFALRLTTRDAFQKPYQYITETNRSELKNGDLLLFTLSPMILCKILLERLKTIENEKLVEESLEFLSNLSQDKAIVDELISQNGLTFIITLIEGGQLANLSKSSTYLLTIFWQLMDIGRKSWDDVTEKLIHEVALFVIGGTKIVHPKATSIALVIIEAISTTSSKFNIVEKEVPAENLVILLFSSDYQVQHNTLAVINAIFARMDSNGKAKMAQLLRSAAVRDPILTNVLRDKTAIGAELAHQLHVLQRNLLNLYEIRAKTPVTQNSPEAEKLSDLRRATFETFGETFSPNAHRKNPASQIKDFKKLGFQNLQNPIEDFHKFSAGALALDCMLYFATKHYQNFNKIIVQNSCRHDHKECPFAQTSLHLTSVLLEICKVGESPSEEGQTFYEVFFTHENPFEELFSISINLLNKTWREMKATINEDLSKVLSVVKEQILRSLQKHHKNFKSLEVETKNYPYSEILKLWDQQQLEKEENEFSHPQIIELKQLFKPQIMKLVKENRFSALKKGQEFAKYSKGQKGSREKGKFWFWKLAPNEKSLLFADCQENIEPKPDELKGIVNIDEISEIRTGNDCPHIKELMKSKNKTACNEFAFSILFNNYSIDNCFNFVATDSKTFDTWIDGLEAARGRPMTSKSASQESESFLNLDIKLRLIELENVGVQLDSLGPPPPLADEAPPILLVEAANSNRHVTRNSS